MSVAPYKILINQWYIMWWMNKEVAKNIFFDKTGALEFWFRLVIVAIFTVIAYLVAFETNMVNFILRDLSENDIHKYSLTILLFAVIAGFGGFLIRTFDKRKEFNDVFQQQNEILKQRNETLFSNALQLLYKENNQTANCFGCMPIL